MSKLLQYYRLSKISKHGNPGNNHFAEYVIGNLAATIYSSMAVGGGMITTKALYIVIECPNSFAKKNSVSRSLFIIATRLTLITILRTLG